MFPSTHQSSTIIDISDNSGVNSFPQQNRKRRKFDRETNEVIIRPIFIQSIDGVCPDEFAQQRLFLSGVHFNTLNDYESQKLTSNQEIYMKTPALKLLDRHRRCGIKVSLKT
ncbi:hypothetical protein QAD02_013956 [Eretmocerus hayati]|uniref:Uncharacterized protein n=1 Tax=Eretmocerus hayati TaxID=131215 RepID=A0ACC2P6G9_9HYME|nr:hypothetical protein QAD02_013956 [Eretmocerus hayati]